MMTYKEIRQLGEEFMKAVPESWPYDSDALTTIEIAEDVIEWLTERYSIVEKSKINALQSEIFKGIMDSHEAEDWQGVAHYVLDVMPRTFSHIFSSQLGKEAEV